MNEENNEQIIVQKNPNRKPLYIASAVIVVLVLGVLGLWFMRNRETGQVVQPPRNVTFGENTGEQPPGGSQNGLLIATSVGPERPAHQLRLRGDGCERRLDHELRPG